MKNISNKLKLICALLLSVPIACKAMEEKKNPNPIVYLFVTYEANGTYDCLADGEALRSDFINGIKSHIKRNTRKVTDESIPPKPKFRQFVIEQDYESLSAQEQINLARELYNDILKYKRFAFTPVHVIVSHRFAYEAAVIAGQLFTDKAQLLLINQQNDISRDMSVKELSDAFITQLNIGNCSTRSHGSSENNGTIFRTCKWQNNRAKRGKKLNGTPVLIENFNNIDTERDNDISEEDIDDNLGELHLIQALHVVTNKTRNTFFKHVRPAYTNQNIGTVSFLTTAKTTDNGEGINVVALDEPKKQNKFVGSILCCFGGTAEVLGHPATQELIKIATELTTVIVISAIDSAK